MAKYRKLNEGVLLLKEKEAGVERHQVEMVSIRLTKTYLLPL